MQLSSKEYNVGAIPIGDTSKAKNANLVKT